MPSFSSRALTDFATRLLAAGGIGADEAALIATSLVGANLRGHDSHGVMRVPSYLDAFAKGEVVAGRRFRSCEKRAACWWAMGIGASARRKPSGSRGS